MIKLIIFDLDGVLVNARELHYNALNRALDSIDKKYVIEREEHLSTYDGLSTKKKLNLLTKNKDLPKELHDKVWELKQQMTLKIIDGVSIDDRIRGILRSFKSEGYIISCATNSIRETAKLQLIRKYSQKMGLLKHNTQLTHLNSFHMQCHGLLGFLMPKHQSLKL